MLSAIATVTDRLRLTASAVIAPLRHPLLLARELGILDLLSGGRLIVLPNVSWSRDDYAALGVPFSRRGRLFNEHPEIRRKLWGTSAMSHESEYSPSRTSPSSPRHTARMTPDCRSAVRACTTRWSARGERHEVATGMTMGDVAHFGYRCCTRPPLCRPSCRLAAHQDPNEVRRIYNRARYWDERKKLMQQWADLLDEFKVVSLQKAA